MLPSMVNMCGDDADFESLMMDDTKARRFKTRIMNNPYYQDILKEILPQFDREGLLDPLEWGRLLITQLIYYLYPQLLSLLIKSEFQKSQILFLFVSLWETGAILSKKNFKDSSAAARYFSDPKSFLW